MFRTLFATTALSAVMATAVIAQQAQDTTQDGDAPIMLQDDQATDEATTAQETDTADPTDDPTLADDPAAPADDPLAQEPMAEPTDPAMADDPAADAQDPALADDPAVETQDPELADDPAAPADGPDLAESPDPEAPTIATMPGEQAMDLAQVPGDELVGSEVRGFDDDQIGTVNDVVTDAGGQPQSILVRFGGFLGLGASTVELQADEVAVVRTEEDALLVRTELTQEELENRPQYEAN